LKKQSGTLRLRSLTLWVPGAKSESSRILEKQN
jgi:hypothetical protein